jgi:Fungal chitosanase of glycosyl hydrolase group 75
MMYAGQMNFAFANQHAPLLAAVLSAAIACSSSVAQTDPAVVDAAVETGAAFDAGGDTAPAKLDASAPDAGSMDAARDALAPDTGAPGLATAAQLLAKVAACGGRPIKGGFGLDGPGNLSIKACPGVLFWKADMDVDCDGIQTPPCNIDPQGQPQTSLKDTAPSGDIDPTKLPYFVIPLGKPETAWYTQHGVELGQVGAVIYNGQVRYGIFADEAGGWFIGEASYAMCQLFLGKPANGKDPCSPVNGGLDQAAITYVTFTGAANQAKGQALYDHLKHTQMGEAAASQWLAGP